MGKNHKVEVVIYSLSVAVSIGIAYLGVYIIAPENIDAYIKEKDILVIILSVVLSFFLIILTALAKVSYVQSRNRELVMENHVEIKGINERQKYNTELMSILVKLSEQSDILEATGKESISKFLSEFYVDNDSIEFKSEALAISSYKVFWEKLVELQEGQKRTNLIARITHSNPIEVWDNATDEDYMPQEEFIKNKGIVIRVLIDYQCKLEDRDIYARVFQNMKSRGIYPIYLPMHEKGTRPKHDFVSVDTGAWVYVVEWRSDPGGRTIASSVISRYSGQSKIPERNKLKVIANSIRKREFNEGTPEILMEEVPENILHILEE